MNGSEFVAVILFYLTFSLFAGIGLPVASRFIQNRTLAYIASKPLGLLIFGYLVWVLSYFRVLNYQSKGLILATFLILVAGGFFLAWRGYRSLPAEEEVTSKKKDKSKKAYPWYVKTLALEAGTLLLLLIYLSLRSHNAGINGTERFMDLALLTASGKTDYFPFIDPWYAGKTVNYYYYGSYLMSLISNLSRIPYEVSYNIALGLVYVQSVMLSASLVFAKTRSKLFAFLVAFIITTAGTVFYTGCVFREEFVENAPVCSYASSTRLYTPSYIINEIPSYSFTVGDLHAHVLALPFFLLTIILLYALYESKKPGALIIGSVALAIASLSMINSWDAVTAGCLLGFVILAKLFEVYKTTENTKLKAFIPWLITGAVTLGFALVLMVPNFLGFKSPVLGLTFAPTYVAQNNLTNVQWPTPLTAEFGMWGIFLISIAVAIYAKRKQLGDWGFPIILALLSLGIIIGVEFFFIQDIYGVTNPPYFRANTTFKFGYHAWSMLAIAFSIFMAALYYKEPQEKITFAHKWVWLPITVMLLAGMFYPYKAIKQFYLTGNLEQGLDGTLWMKTEAPNDRATIEYINKELTDKRYVIAEAVGDSYTTYGRISAYTGMITPMGWKTHEWTWRFNGKAALGVPKGQTVETGYGPISVIADEVKKMYETDSVDEARSLIQKHNIEYIYVGDLERKMYLNLSAAKFNQLAEPIFNSGNSTLYKVK